MGLKDKLTLAKFEEACETVSKVTRDTSLIYSDYFSERTGGKVYLKPENNQRTGAYKVRGAYYKISTLSAEERERGLITASAGNHAQGVAYAAKQFGAKAVIVMPTTTPLIKVNRTKALGAEVVLYGDVYDEACEHAFKLAEENGYTFIHPFDDPDVATGQGTIAMEIIKELPLVDIILVPVGGGGLATGVSTLMKMLKPEAKVYGVEPEGAACLKASLEAGEVGTLPQIGFGPGRLLPRHGGEPQDDRRELRPSDGGGTQTHSLQGQKSGLDPERRQHGRDHDVQRRAAGTYPARQDLHDLRPSPRQAG